MQSGRLSGNRAALNGSGAHRRWQADGVILRDTENLRRVRALGVPAVVIGHGRREIPGFVNVVTDSAQIGRMAAEHLRACGFRNFACCHPRQTPWAEARAHAFVRHLRAAGLPVAERRLPPLAKIDWSQERQALARWLETLPQPVGIMAANDDVGVQLLEACKLAGLPVPDAVGVVGVDNDELVCGLATPAMSSVALNFERAGYEAAQALDRLLRRRGRVPRQISVPATHVVARRSTDMVAVGNPALTRALRFMRDYAREPVTVAAVAAAAGLSRRGLERRFRGELKTSVKLEIRRVRAEQIARLLVETHLSIGAIAEALHFEDVRHLARYFRTAKKMSPLAFRRRFGAISAAPSPRRKMAD
jgi:LacI family transcriptional regulator